MEALGQTTSVLAEKSTVLRERLASAGRELHRLERERQSIEQELRALSEDTRQFELVESICSMLEELDDLGASGLFWGEALQDRSATERTAEIRVRALRFNDGFAAVEQRLRTATEEVQRQRAIVLDLEDDLYDVIQQEERRKLEWIVEREISKLAYRQPVMPWSRGGEDDQRFVKSLLALLLIGFLFSISMPMIPIPQPDTAEIIEIPERLAELIQQEQPLPPPEPEPEPVAEEEPDEPEPEPEEELLAEEPVPVNEPTEEAREAVAQTGILAFRDNFASLAQNRPSAQLGLQASLTNAGEEISTRSMVTTQGPGSSGGINLASLSRGVGGGGPGIQGVDVGRVESAIGANAVSDRPMSNGAPASRTDEEIQIVFDRYKSALYRLYNRELRNNPTLRGQIVLRITIESDGSVSTSVVESSTMGAPALEQQIADRVKLFNFGAKEDISTMTILYPIDFLPAG